MSAITISPNRTIDDVQNHLRRQVTDLGFRRMGPTLIAYRTPWVGTMVNVRKGKVTTAPATGHFGLMLLYPLLVATLFGLIFLLPRLREQGKLRDAIDTAVRDMN